MLLFGIIYTCFVAATYITSIVELICNIMDTGSFKFSEVTPFHVCGVALPGALLSICYYIAAWRAPEQGFTFTGASIFLVAALAVTLFTAFGFPPLFSFLWKVLSPSVVKVQSKKRRFEQWVDKYSEPNTKN